MQPMQQTAVKPQISQPSVLFMQRAQKLVAIPSTFDNRKACQDALEYMAGIIYKRPGITIEHFERNGVRSLLAYAGTHRPRRFKVLLNGHLDVVPGTASQLQPHITNGRLYGRGTLDMKVAALILTEAFCEFAPHLPLPIGLQLTTDEEPGGYNGAKFQFEQGVRTDFFLTGEQSWNDIAVAAKGMCRLKIRYKGVAAHSGYLWRGENALLKITRLIDKLHFLYPLPTEEAWVTTVNVAKIQTNSDGAFNRVPDAAEVHLDIRPLVEDPHFATLETIYQLIAHLDPEAEIYEATYERGHETAVTHPTLQALIDATKLAKGEVSLLRRHAQSDLRHYNADPECRGVEFGLKGKHDHGDGEYLDLRSVPIMQKAMRHFLINLT